MLFGLIKTKKDKRIEELEKELAVANICYMQADNEVRRLRLQQSEIKPYKAVKILTRRELNMPVADRQRFALDDMCRDFTDFIREHVNIKIKDDVLGGKRYEMTILVGFPRG